MCVVGRSRKWRKPGSNRIRHNPTLQTHKNAVSSRRRSLWRRSSGSLSLHRLDEITLGPHRNPALSDRRVFTTEELNLEEIRDEFATLAAHGGMDGISAILRIARDQIDLRPTGEDVVAIIVTGLVIAVIGIICYQEINHHLAWGLACTGIVLAGCTGITYLVTSYTLDLMDRQSNRVIRSEARKAIATAIDCSQVVPQPLEKEKFKLLRRLAKGNPDFRLKVKPILSLGPAPPEHFSVEDEP
jgi:hypothetical protein